MRLHNDIWWLLGSTLATVCVAPLLVHGDANLTARRTAAAQKIEQLTPAERQQLDANRKRFEKLAPAEQARYRELHDKVEQNPKVGEALETFSQWWPTVSAREQAEVFSAKESPAKRLEIVSRIQDDLEKDVSSFFGFGRFGRGDLRINPADFHAIMDAVEDIAVDSRALNDVDKEELDKLPKYSAQRAFALIKRLHEKQKNFRDIVSDEAQESQVANAVPTESLRASLERRMRDRDYGNGFVRGVLAGMLFRELMRENMKQPIGDKELQAALSNMSKDQRSDLYAYSADEQRKILSHAIITKKLGGGVINEFFQVPRFEGPGGRIRMMGGRVEGGRDDGNGPPNDDFPRGPEYDRNPIP